MQPASSIPSSGSSRPAGDAARARLLEALRSAIAATGYSPTVRELARAAGISSAGATHYHLSILARQGAIRWTPGQCRTLQLVAADGGAR